MSKGRWAAAVIGLAATLAYGFVIVPRAAHDDFRSYHAAARLVLAGQSPYLDPQYIYPPTFAWAMAPLAMFPLTAASAIWYVLSVGLLVAAASLCEPAVSGGVRAGAWRRIGLLLLLSARVWTSNLEHGQTNLLIVFLLVFAFHRSRSPAGGALVGAASVVKVFPMLATLYYVRERRWLILAAALAAALVLLLLPVIATGPSAYAGQLGEWSHRALFTYAPGVSVAPGIMNQSLAAAAVRLLGDSAWARALTLLVQLAIAAFVCLTLFGSPRGTRRFEAFALLMAAMPLFGGLVWKAHYCMLIPAWSILCATGTWTGPSGQMLRFLSFAGPLATLATSEIVTGRQASEALQYAPLFPVVALLAVALLGLRLVGSPSPSNGGAASS